ncbi:uncharacterized protein LOC126836549 isoform X2 [Adelges cooleyi]|nr:uncharacterized protein LOC126836549 isoform X2 [Adelges cooleyi]XP_050426027.1 uncharacterized protein LOC126836549 isoform X2 [Adelges cooleyi]
MALKENDVLFNLLSLKHKFLVPDQICEKCKRSAKNWHIISVCHDIICEECLDLKNETICCPACQQLFNVEEHVTSNEDMKIAYCQMEEFVWKILSLEKGIITESKNTSKSDKTHNDNDEEIKEMGGILDDMDFKNSSTSGDLLEPAIMCPAENNMTNLITNELDKMDNKENECKNQNNVENHGHLLLSPEFEFEEEPKKFKPKCLNFIDDDKMERNENCEIIKNSISKISVSENIKTIVPNIINGKKPPAECNGISYLKENIRDENALEKDVVEGTPEKPTEIKPESFPSISFNKKCKNKSMIITYSNLDTDEELDSLKIFMTMFNVVINPSWVDNVTHVVVKPNNDGTCPRTKKCINALLSNRTIITLKWVEDCIKSQFVLSELNYMPLDMSGEPSPMITWRVGRGIIDSPMAWASNCIVYVHSSMKANEDFTDILSWIKKAGFVLTDSIDKINDTYSIRVVLADIVFIDGKEIGMPITQDTMIDWIFNKKVVTLYWDWMLECLFRYRFVQIEPKYQVLSLTPFLVQQAEMSEFLFEFDDSDKNS